MSAAKSLLELWQAKKMFVTLYLKEHGGDLHNQKQSLIAVSFLSLELRASHVE